MRDEVKKETTARKTPFRMPLKLFVSTKMDTNQFVWFEVQIARARMMQS